MRKQTQKDPLFLPPVMASIVSTHQQIFDKPLRQQFLLKSQKQVW